MSVDPGEDVLSPVAYVLLGLVELHGPSTPYQLKRSLSETVGLLWNVSHAQLYEEPTRLTRAGLMRESRERAGRRRRVMSNTVAGRRALREWLAIPVAQHREIRDPGLLKLFFAQCIESDGVVRLRDGEIQRHHELIQDIDERIRILHSPLGGPPPTGHDLGYRSEVVRCCLVVAQALTEYWSQLVAPPAAAREPNDRVGSAVRPSNFRSSNPTRGGPEHAV